MLDLQNHHSQEVSSFLRIPQPPPRDHLDSCLGYSSLLQRSSQNLWKHKFWILSLIGMILRVPRVVTEII